MSNPNTSQFNPRLCTDITVTIADTATESDAADLNGTSLVGYTLPSGFDGTTLTFKVSTDNVTFFDFYNTNNTQVTHTVAASRAIGIFPTDFAGWRYVKFVAGTSQSTTDTVITVHTMPL